MPRCQRSYQAGEIQRSESPISAFHRHQPSPLQRVSAIFCEPALSFRVAFKTRYKVPVPLPDGRDLVAAYTSDCELVQETSLIL